MTDRPLDKYLNRKPEDREVAFGHADHPAGDEAAPDDLGCFGWLRGVRDRSVMIELRKKDGTIAAFPYAYLERADFDPSEGITLHVMGKHLKIKGRNLNGEVHPQVRLFHGITRHRVPWIQETDELRRPASADEGTHISAIEW